MLDIEHISISLVQDGGSVPFSQHRCGRGRELWLCSEPEDTSREILFDVNGYTYAFPCCDMSRPSEWLPKDQAR